MMLAKIDFRKWTSRVRVEEWLILGVVCIAFFINTFIYHNKVDFVAAAKLMVSYFTFGDPFYALFFMFLWVFYFWKFFVYLPVIVNSYFDEKRLLPAHIKKLVSYAIEPLRIIVPLVILSIQMYALLTNMDYALRFQGKDFALLAFDRALTGTAPFIHLPNIIQAEWFVNAARYSYFSLALFIGIALILLFIHSHRKTFLFRSAIIALVFSLVLSYPFFYVVPCQDPNNFFIRNLRGNTFPADVQQQLSAYRPSQLTATIIDAIGNAETNNEADSAVPVSCFPSMHATWAFIVVYFLAFFTPWSLLITIPWFIFLLTGGIYFAQHYFIDYLAAIPIALFSIALAHFIIRREQRKKENEP